MFVNKIMVIKSIFRVLKLYRLLNSCLDILLFQKYFYFLIVCIFVWKKGCIGDFRIYDNQNIGYFGFGVIGEYEMYNLSVGK